MVVGSLYHTHQGVQQRCNPDLGETYAVSMADWARAT